MDSIAQLEARWSKRLVKLEKQVAELQHDAGIVPVPQKDEGGRLLYDAVVKTNALLGHDRDGGYGAYDRGRDFVQCRVLAQSDGRSRCYLVHEPTDGWTLLEGERLRIPTTAWPVSIVYREVKRSDRVARLSLANLRRLLVYVDFVNIVPRDR